MKNRKWLINTEHVLTDDQRKRYWVKTHTEENYETVWSMTDDPYVRSRIVRELERVECRKKILVPGCGSRVTLQNEIAASLPDIDEILCTDFEGVINVAQKQKNDRIIRYKPRDSKRLGSTQEWDVIVNVNAILSENDTENRDILDSCFKVLKTGDVLIGMFPTIFATVDISYIEEDRERLRFVDFERSAFYEEKQGLWQIYYTPLRLRRILLESGFKLNRMEIYFCDSEYFQNHSNEYYGLSDPDAVIYELFIIAEKP